MLEIIVLWQLCKSLGRILRDKGRKPRPFQILLVVMWFGGELAAGFVAGIVQVARQGQLDPGVNPAVYLFAVLGAACGAGITFLIARQLSPIGEEQPADFGEVSPALLPLGDLMPSDNPYQSPFADVAYGVPQGSRQSSASGFGIASVLTGVAGLLIPIAAVVLAVTWIGAMDGSEDFEPAPLAFLAVGLGVLMGAGLALLGMLLGLIGLLQKNRGRGLPVLGLAVNGLIVAAVGVLLLLSLS